MVHSKSVSPASPEMLEVFWRPSARRSRLILSVDELVHQVITANYYYSFTTETNDLHIQKG